MKTDATMQSIESLLKIAVDKTEDVKGNFKKGLGAIKGSERKKFSVPNTYNITGSLNIDASTATIYPHSNRWDYAIEYNKDTFFVEVHPASTSEIPTIINKLTWLKKWLVEKAPEIDALKPKNKQPYYWIFTNNCAILPNSKYARQLAQNNIKPTKQWNLQIT